MTDRWDAVATLADESRRGLYAFVCRAGHPVSREEAAGALRLSRGLAAFHLDKLVEAGFLAARYQAPPDLPRGRGRAPKVYEPTATEIALTIPARRYELMAEILADAVALDDGRPVGDRARHQARRHGHDIGVGLRADGGDLAFALDDLGFQSESHPDGVRLRNCPFHALAARQPELVCGLNESFLSGLVDGLGAPDTRVRLAPLPGFCCVRIIAQSSTEPDR